MRPPSSFPVMVQVAALAVLAVVMSQAVAFGVVVLAPEPRPAGFSLQAAADALRGQPAVTNDGRALRRHLSSGPVKAPTDETPDPLALVLATALANRLQVPPQSVHVVVDHGSMRRAHGRRPKGVIEATRSDLFVVRRQGRPPPEGWRMPFAPVGAGEAPVVPEAAAGVTIQQHGLGGAFTVDTTTRQFTVLADHLTFAPFTASVLQKDGRWATVEPPRGLLSPWQQRVLLALVISLLLLAPLVWWMARRLTRPIRVFAEAAERLGADPDAAPLTPTGPSEVRTAIAAFNDMQGALRDHMRKRTQTVAAIAHDLRTPLTRLRFRAEQAPDSVRDRMAADIEEMDGLIAQAMAYVRGEAPPERREPLDLGALARDCAAGFSETGAAVTFDGGAVLLVEGDPAALRRAVANLIDNAVKFGGGARVRAFSDNGAATVAIEDDGPGLAEGELAAAFEPFQRGERSRNRDTGGAGLGLAVARQAARGGGGEVELFNREGGGLTARLTLPLTRPDIG